MKNPLLDTGLHNRFVSLWQKYCRGEELPLTFEICVMRGTAEREREISDGWQYAQKLHCYFTTQDGKIWAYTNIMVNR
jgi:hypothetical protein